MSEPSSVVRILDDGAGNLRSLRRDLDGTPWLPRGRRSMSVVRILEYGGGSLASTKETLDV